MLDKAEEWGERSEDYFIKLVYSLYAHAETQRQVADLLGVPFGTLRRWLRKLNVTLTSSREP